MKTEKIDLGLNGFVIENGILTQYNGAERDVTVPEGVREIGRLAFCFRVDVESVTLPEGLTAIGEGAFCGCFSLNRVHLPVGVTSIGDGAFSACAKLSDVDLPEELISIGSEAFADCENLSALIFPKSVVRVGNAAFRARHGGLQQVYYKGAAADLRKMKLGSACAPFRRATKYFYSPEAPTKGRGNFWRYVDGTPTPW